MRAALTTKFQDPPRYTAVDEPRPREQEIVVEVLAAGLHPRVRSQANGSHYTADEQLPIIPGIDGVGRRADGGIVYFFLPETRWGSMAQRVAIDPRRSVQLPDAADPVVLAATVNPVLSAWIALKRRIQFTKGHRVLVLGATGTAGQMAVEVARQAGASHVAGAGRSSTKLAELRDTNIDTVIDLTAPDSADQLAAVGSEVDVVLDYLWGAPTASAMQAIVPARTDDGQQLTWVQIGSAAGPECAIPAAVLRAARVQIVGSGQGSVSPSAIFSELPDLAASIIGGAYQVPTCVVPLADVESAWAKPATGVSRIVIVP